MSENIAFIILLFKIFWEFSFYSDLLLINIHTVLEIVVFFFFVLFRTVLSLPTRTWKIMFLFTDYILTYFFNYLLYSFLGIVCCVQI